MNRRCAFLLCARLLHSGWWHTLGQDKLATTDSGLVINYFAVSFDERFVRW